MNLYSSSKDIIENNEIIAIQQTKQDEYYSHPHIVLLEIEQNMADDELMIFRKRKGYEVYSLAVRNVVFYMNIRNMAYIINKLPEYKFSVRESKK